MNVFFSWHWDFIGKDPSNHFILLIEKLILKLNLKIHKYFWLLEARDWVSNLFSFFFFFNIYLFILFLPVLGLLCKLGFCARAFSSCGKRGPLFIAVRGPLTIVASLVAEHRLQTRRLCSCGSRAQLLRGMWDLPGPGLEPVSPALAGGFSTTAPPGKPCFSFFYFLFLYFFLATPCSIRGPSSPARDRTHAPCSGSAES